MHTAWELPGCHLAFPEACFKALGICNAANLFLSCQIARHYRSGIPKAKERPKFRDSLIIYSILFFLTAAGFFVASVFLIALAAAIVLFFLFFFLLFLFLFFLFFFLFLLQLLLLLI